MGPIAILRISPRPDATMVVADITPPQESKAEVAALGADDKTSKTGVHCNTNVASLALLDAPVSTHRTLTTANMGPTRTILSGCAS